jgi:L-ribulose-5-phosphate 3-epimerase
MRRWKIGYNTSGFTRNQTVEQIADVLHGTGYESIEITICKEQLHPFVHDRARFAAVGKHLDGLKMARVLCTGGDPFVLSDKADEPWIHSADADGRALSVKFFEQMIDVCDATGANTMMLHSGVLRSEGERGAARERLVDSLKKLLPRAEKKGIALAMEYNPNMIVRTLEEFLALRKDLGSSEALQLTLDVGHSMCIKEGPIGEIVKRAGKHIKNVQLEDVRDNTDYHLPPSGGWGGQVDFVDFFKALDAIDYAGPVNYEFCDMQEVERGLAGATLDLLARIRPDLKKA